MKDIQVPQNIVDSLYELRLIVLIEDEPHSNRYYQVMFNEEQFKKVSGSVSKVFENVTDRSEIKKNFEVYEIEVDENTEIILPDDIKSAYE